MRLLRLDLTAFGPFTASSLRFPNGNPGFHIVYGPNEAGKSSALRALHQMLFGIPERTGDDFVHPYSKLRIGGLMERSDGRQLEIIRRKGRIHTLRGPDDITVLEETRLQSFLGGVDEDLFATMFGIDHTRLVEGGQAILQGAGDAGQILFSAGAGIADFRKVLVDLRSEAENLFKPAAQKPVINAGLSELQKIRKAQREAQLPGQEWAAHDHALREATVRKTRIEADLERETRRRNRLMRIRDALPAMARRAELLGQYETVRTAVLLPGDFSKRRLSAIEALRIAESRQSRTEKRIQAIRRDLEGMTVSEPIIDNSDTIGALFQEAGSILKAETDRLRLEGLLSSARLEARERLRALNRNLPLAQADTLRLEKSAVIRIQELIARYERLQARRTGIGEEIEKLTFRTDRLKKDLAALRSSVDLGDLKQVISETTAFGDLESRYETLQTDVQRAETELQIALSRLPLWAGSSDALERLPLPSPETVDQFEVHLKTSEDRLIKHRTEAAALSERLEEIDAELRRLALSGDIPTEADLAAARSLRDRAWQEIRKGWVTKASLQHDTADIPLDDISGVHSADRYESMVRDADEIADRLRREAERVAGKAALLAEKERMLDRHQQAKETIKSIKSECAKAHEAWTGLWRASKIQPLSPREMRGWLQRQTDLVGQIIGMRDQAAKADVLRRHIVQCREALVRHLGAPNPGGNPPKLIHLLAQAKAAVSANERLEARKLQLTEDLAQRTEELQEAGTRGERAAEELQVWRRHWEEAVRPLGLDAGASPAQANAILVELNALFEKLRDADILAARMRGIDRDADAFAAKVRDVISMQAPDLIGLSPAQAARELNTRLSQALKVKATREGLEKQLEQERKAAKEASEQAHQLRAHLEALCREAGCDDYEALQDAEKRSEARRQIEADLERIEAQLRSLSAGRPLAEFIADAASEDPDTLDLQITRLAEDMNRLNQEKSELDQAIGSHRTELAKMDGGHQAADLAEQGQALLAGIRADVDRFLRLRVAAVLLNRAMERYREKNQGPIIERATRLFSRMTLNSFEGLRLEFDDKNDAVLVGVRPGGKEVVHVSGMSDGTADQLYLAIRLASLEAYLKNNEPLPFIVDDILVQFDDRRAGATLEVLFGLSRKTQVIFFTHHRHLLDLARSRLNEGADIHTLGPRSGVAETG